jgi:hypothetical protein
MSYYINFDTGQLNMKKEGAVNSVAKPINAISVLREPLLSLCSPLDSMSLRRGA